MNIEEILFYVQERLSDDDIKQLKFIRAFNRATYYWMEQRMKVMEGNQNVQEELQHLLVNYCGTPSTDKTGCYIPLPKDYYRYSRVEGLKCGECEINIHAFPKEESSLGRFSQNSFYEPSLKWEETWFLPRNNKLYFGVKDFKCKEISLYYYRCPVEVDMECLGDGHSDVDPEFSKGSLEEIITLTELLLSGDTLNPRYQLIANEVQNYT